MSGLFAHPHVLEGVCLTPNAVFYFKGSNSSSADPYQLQFLPSTIRISVSGNNVENPPCDWIEREMAQMKASTDQVGPFANLLT